STSSYACSNRPVLQRPVEPAQYLAIAYTERLTAARIQASVGTVGDSYDNALAETVNGLYKTELIYSQPSWASLTEVEFATMNWVHWWNTTRLHQNLGYRTPTEIEADYYANSTTEEHLATA
ncbi:integrase core domain-containing protein, partial [Brevibacterium daeguense]|uniref:integrase core domain-containing protein n=2 Tax=Brevibacterium daeguense TaxID=909936 RepID=UPI0031D15EAE